MLLANVFGLHERFSGRQDEAKCCDVVRLKFEFFDEAVVGIFVDNRECLNVPLLCRADLAVICEVEQLEELFHLRMFVVEAEHGVFVLDRELIAAAGHPNGFGFRREISRNHVGGVVVCGEQIIDPFRRHSVIIPCSFSLT